MTVKQLLLPILKRGAGDKAVEKCELTIVDPEVGDADEEEDSLESKLVVRMHCKHGGACDIFSWTPSAYTLLRCGEDAQTPTAHDRVSPPVYG